MKRFASIALALGTLTSMFWFDVAPNGVALCQSNVRFNTVNQTENQLRAADTAKAEFCRTVSE